MFFLLSDGTLIFLTVGLLAKAAAPEPEPESSPDLDDEYADILAVVAKFVTPDYGDFDELTALALAWNGVSPSDVRERWVKKGATREQITDYFLGRE